MANLSIYDPFNTRLNRIFNHLLWNSPSLLDEQDPTQALKLKLDVSEDEKNYTVHADLPGVKKEDIRVSVEGNQVTISAELNTRKEEKKDKNVIYSERYEGKVFRSFTLDRGVDESKAEAKYADGVLVLTLPKKTDGNNSKQLEVK
ncbi:MAG: Hsp20/alpha crystallin family protein [Burkholderiaceae bacterium]|nr:Hsp20/alpha crystallin family protein [Burkholderiaceae bacterium]